LPISQVTQDITGNNPEMTSEIGLDAGGGGTYPTESAPTPTTSKFLSLKPTERQIVIQSLANKNYQLAFQMLGLTMPKDRWSGSGYGW